MNILLKKNKILKALVLLLELLAFVLLVYLISLPFYPEVKYEVDSFRGTLPESKDVEIVREEVGEIINHLPVNDFDVSPNRVIIPKIGVNSPIVQTKNSEYGLSLGSWHVPESSTPDKGGNTVITGHRFKYLPPSNLTFYLFHKLEAGDVVSVIWHEKEYYYKIREIKIVEKTDFTVLAKSDEPILTMFTCHPIYSTDKRLVVVAELLEE